MGAIGPRRGSLRRKKCSSARGFDLKKRGAPAETRYFCSGFLRDCRLMGVSQLRGSEVQQKQGVSITGPALLGIAAVVIASIWIYLLFFVIQPMFNGTPAP